MWSVWNCIFVLVENAFLKEVLFSNKIYYVSFGLSGKENCCLNFVIKFVKLVITGMSLGAGHLH